MSSRGHTAIAALAVVLVVLVAAGPAGAALSNGLNGNISDADTGLRVGGATVVWRGTTNPVPSATTDTTGRYLFLGLDGGTTGTLGVIGPAGWDRANVPGITLPATGVGTQHVAIHRDWATPAGGASASAANDAGAADAASCGPTAAVDTDRATGWSASAGAGSGRPTLTVQLPQAIDLRELVLDAGASCGHAAGAALRGYRIETSSDGSTWTVAAQGDVPADHVGADTTLTPAAGAVGVRFVRLALLSAQDGSSPTIDVRELAVHGVGPNAPPTGSVSADVTRVPVKAAIHFQASFTDADSSIVRYLWDFDGDGRWDQATLGPSVAHAWAGTGAWHVTVGVRDFVGGLGTASIDLHVVDPSVPVEPIPQRKPLITFGAVEGIDLPTRTACASRCIIAAKFVIGARDARKLHLEHRTLRAWRKTSESPLASFTFTLPQTVVKRLRRHHYKKLRVRVTLVAVDQQGRRATKRRWVTFR